MTEILLGIDEVGRGSIAGPLYSAAVILKSPIAGLKDSKLLSRHQRESLFDKIVANAEDIGIGYADPLFIDEFGLTKANQFAMEQACNNIQVSYDRIIIDGNFNYLKQLPKSEAIIKADQKYNCVSAASIIAKVTRDRVMYRYDEQYPGYNFISNVGYPTKEHYLAIAKLGITPIHRVSFKLFR
ncbi:MAG TPA: ribonuclease HII [Candidatus Dormibacteraeota bacterium]|nr:ribonuclease HII [Candidatus Dormibacteraeota bacterium]